MILFFHSFVVNGSVCTLPSAYMSVSSLHKRLSLMRDGVVERRAKLAWTIPSEKEIG